MGGDGGGSLEGSVWVKREGRSREGGLGWGWTMNACIGGGREA